MPFLSPEWVPQPNCLHPTAPITGTRVISYTFDPLYWLTSAGYSTGECNEYGYDRVGNRTALTTTVGLTGYQYDATHRLTNAGGQAYTWDNNGSLTNNGKFTFTYNTAGRMTRAQGITTTRTYAYAISGRQTRRKSHASHRASREQQQHTVALLSLPHFSDTVARLAVGLCHGGEADQSPDVLSGVLAFLSSWCKLILQEPLSKPRWVRSVTGHIPFGI